MSVADEAAWYLREHDHHNFEGKTSVSVLKRPTHGVLENGGDGNYAYFPEKGYIGKDRATLLVEVGGKKVKMEYFFRVMQSIPQDYETGPSKYEESKCPKKVRVWKISSTLDPNGNNTLIAAEFQSSATNAVGTPDVDAAVPAASCAAGRRFAGYS